ncbi:hypothetical protein BDU57DRAFT_521617 [Ampelomyces quisqualis]|uniref:Uncharacterized protein n=1 Tax=Ampelomyces quisqualis TaxID=50730 RepID=A0A6A5QBR6_AMPQU|nr:hypothetical protein BDU57DRAFT_521617 [Ampelomyces quisqualis]
MPCKPTLTQFTPFSIPRILTLPLKLLALTTAIYILPTAMHTITTSLSDLYDLVGRRARSPYAPDAPLASVIGAGVMLLAWHVWLGRLSYVGIMEGTKRHGGMSWGRLLGRIVLPGVLLVTGVVFAAGVGRKVRGEGVVFVKGNTI